MCQILRFCSEKGTQRPTYRGFRLYTGKSKAGWEGGVSIISPKTTQEDPFRCKCLKDNKMGVRKSDVQEEGYFSHPGRLI